MKAKEITTMHVPCLNNGDTRAPSLSPVLTAPPSAGRGEWRWGRNSEQV